MNHETTDNRAGLDELALVLDRENSALQHLEFRLNSLRLALIDGDAGFVQTAATEADTAALAVTELGPPREAALRRAMAELGLDPATPLASIPDAAPSPQRELLDRLVRELVGRTRAIRIQRDAVRTLADQGRRAVAGVLDLDSAPGDPSIDLGDASHRGTLFVGEL